jgi:diguanylate cyclase (GGDEF)-like protein
MPPPPEDTHKLAKVWADVADWPTDPGGTDDASLLPDPTAAVTEAYLVHIYPPGPTVGRRFLVGRDPVTIGRLPDCGVLDPDPSVSRAHARIGLGPEGGFVVTDLGSTNGTHVNRARVSSAVLLDGAYLRVGNSMYRFLAGGNVEAEYHEEIHRLAVTDPLTGLPNRRAMMEFLGRELIRARRHSRPVSLVLFDVDRFKAVNDRYGHMAGDDVLRALAEVVRPLVRQDELLARYGGEEFAVVLPETDADGAYRCGERLRRAVEVHPFVFGEHRIAVTVSAGVGSIAPGEAADEALDRADKRLYEAKQSGRNRVCPGSPLG